MNSNCQKQRDCIAGRLQGPVDLRGARHGDVDPQFDWNSSAAHKGLKLRTLKSADRRLLHSVSLAHGALLNYGHAYTHHLVTMPD